MGTKTPPELQELIESIERDPAPERPRRRLPRRPLIALLGAAAFASLLALAAPGALAEIVADPLRAISLAVETISGAISVLLR